MNVRHLLNDSNNEGLTTWFHSSSYPTKKLRTYLNIKVRMTSDVDAIISNCSRLRVLELQRFLRIRNLPDKLGRLLHLRYLDLSYNIELEMLPKSITRLYNLQTLILDYCKRLKELPEDTSKLVNLRVLNIYRCENLSHMPAGMCKLTSLHTLTMFIVHGDDDDLKQDEKGNMKDLIALINNLRGYLEIRYKANSNSVVLHYVSVDLYSLKLRCHFDPDHKEGQEKLLESLFCNHQFQELKLHFYGGTKLQSWVSGLVSITLYRCNNMQYLPSSLSQLCHLKYLRLDFMENMEYIECDAPPPSVKFFSALEKLELDCMVALKGWWRRDVRWMEKEAFLIPSFPCLCELSIQYCEKLTYIPPCPFIKELYLYQVNEALGNCMKVGRVESNPISLVRFGTDNSCIYNSIGREFVGSAVWIELRGIEILETNREGFQSCASSLRDLKIRNCRGVENLGLEHLTNLKSLRLDDNIEGIPWKSLHSLSSLKIYDNNFVTLDRCSELTSLPKGIQYLTSLQSLLLKGCSKLKSLPEEMRCLTSLATLEIQYPSSEIKSRCQPEGEDWPKICHIPNLNIN